MMSISRWYTVRFHDWTPRIQRAQPVRVVELASGTGAVTELILDELERLGRPGTVIGVEPSPEAIEIATARLESRGATFVQGEADSAGDGRAECRRYLLLQCDPSGAR